MQIHFKPILKGICIVFEKTTQKRCVSKNFAYINDAIYNGR